MSETKESCVKTSEQVKVIVRCRPMSKKEIKAGYKNVIDIPMSHKAIMIHDPAEDINDSKMFTYDAVYDFTSTQEQLYKESVEPIVGSVLKGFNATIFAYGQTGTGKTYTMEGMQSNKNEKGVILRSFDQIFEHISYYTDTKYNVKCSYVEIYQEEIKDLLNKSGTKPIELRGDHSNVYIRNLISINCKNAADMERVMKIGNVNRKTGATNMNQRSSRSHAIFIILVEIVQIILDTKLVKVGKLNLVDLAGSERQTKSQSSGVRLKEAAKINFSLSALGNVISALSKEKGRERNAHIPYRDCKLTRILQDSLGGNARTLMIANIGPACYNYTESLNTLKYANRAKNIKNKPIINEDSTKDELIQKCQYEVKRLRKLVDEKCFTEETESDLKRSKTKAIDNEIELMQNKVDSEEARLYNTCVKIAKLQEWKNDLEKNARTDIKCHLTNLQHDIMTGECDVINMKLSKKETERKIEKERQKKKQLKSLEVKQTDGMIHNIEMLHKTYSVVMNIKSETCNLKEKIKAERTKMEDDHKKLLSNHSVNQIVIDNFLSGKNQKEYEYSHKEMNWPVNEIGTMLEDFKLKLLNDNDDIVSKNPVNYKSNQLQKDIILPTNELNNSELSNCEPSTSDSSLKCRTKFVEILLAKDNPYNKYISIDDHSSCQYQVAPSRKTKFKELNLGTVYQSSLKLLKEMFKSESN